ncbi:MAG: 50S ribosomal protein L34e [Candidatus ainarchaeum sp.]|nr:50S ribosomal protein L34e [Candidatus ainarchaeum sp.]
MPSPDKRYKKHKTIKTPGGKTVRRIVKKKTKKQTCAVCTSLIHGVPHGKRPFEVKKLSKTERRPENLLAPILCPKCRDVAYKDAVMLKNNLKTEADCDFRYIKYVKMILKKIE